MAKLNPFKFMQEVRQEVNKVTWPSRKETGITTAMVFVFAALAAIFFLLADQVIRIAVTLSVIVSGVSLQPGVRVRGLDAGPRT